MAVPDDRQARVAAVLSRDNNLGSLGSGARERRLGVVADPPGVGDRSLLLAIDAQQVVCCRGAGGPVARVVAAVARHPGIDEDRLPRDVQLEPQRIVVAVATPATQSHATDIGEQEAPLIARDIDPCGGKAAEPLSPRGRWRSVRGTEQRYQNQEYRAAIEAFDAIVHDPIATRVDRARAYEYLGMSWLILGQVPRWLTLAGGALCLAGVAVSRSKKRSLAPREEVPDSVGA